MGHVKRYGAFMIEIARSQHVFELKLMQQKLEEAGVGSVILDEHTGGLMQGIGNIYPRLMVLEEDEVDAKAIVAALSSEV